MNYIYGAGGHGKVVLEALKQTGRSCVAFIDDRPLQEWATLPVLSADQLPTDACLHLAIGNSKVREALSLQWAHLGFFSVLHPQAALASSAKIALGTLVAAQAVVGPDAYVGNHVIINHGAVVDHDCKVDHFCHIAPNATLGGGVSIGKHVLIGAGAVVLPGLRIADHVTIGAGAVVTTHILQAGVFVGCPARPVES